MVSNVMDSYTPWWDDKNNPNNPNTPPFTPEKVTDWINSVPRMEFEALKKEVKELRKVIEAAAEFDKKTNQPNCHNDEKLALLKALADALGVDLSNIT